MTTIRLTAEITQDGQLKVDLPSGLPPGTVEISIELAPEAWTNEEIDRLMIPEPMTAAAIVAAGLTGGWKDQGILDGSAWLQELRRKRRDQRLW